LKTPEARQFLEHRKLGFVLCLYAWIGLLFDWLSCWGVVVGGVRGKVSCLEKHARAICGNKSPKPGLNLSGS